MYESIIGISIAFVAGVATAIVNKYIINNPVVNRNINRYCCCGRCDNIFQPQAQQVPPSRRNTN